MKKIKGYKFIQKNMKSQRGNIKWKVGEWNKHEGNIELCEEGLHACRTALQSLDYVYGDKWFMVEARGRLEEEKGDKFVCSEMRLVKELPIDKILKLFAIRCAKRCLKNYEKEYPNDKRVFEAIEGAELYLDKKIKLPELKKRIDAAKSAAKSAAWSAGSAAKSAAWSARSAAKSAAWSARSAAWSAARSARSAAWSAEIKWQEKELEKIIKVVLKEAKVSGSQKTENIPRGGK